jgi:MFS family permease
MTPVFSPEERSVGSASAVLFFSGFSLYGAMLLLPLFYQDVRGATTLGAGVMLVPQGVGTFMSRFVTGSNIDGFGSRILTVAGFVIVAAATVPFALAGPHTNGWLLALWMVIRGFGLGAAPGARVARLAVPRRAAGRGPRPHRRLRRPARGRGEGETVRRS